MTTVLSALTEEQVRIVRDDRSAIADGVFRILETPIDGIALRKAVFAFVAGLHAEAMTETIMRLAAHQEQESEQ